MPEITLPPAASRALYAATADQPLTTRQIAERLYGLSPTPQHIDRCRMRLRDLHRRGFIRPKYLNAIGSNGRPTKRLVWEVLRRR